ncbi:glycosyltransferase family 90 protein [Amniculicola lignicola CBS 123094]|uniref:Glycosyltransferase family 90 protein n=1 Tax=Amniculicola lignicola CBS 123094 TaxID=1392246 RepID=A0A6A5WCX2_9PLEO|nr:glycosyltransferase family 90 protein [Amniculicola lignicola CBS 123094]
MACSPRLLPVRVLTFITVAIIFTGTVWLWRRDTSLTPSFTVPHDYRPITPVHDLVQSGEHPIDYLMKKAETEWHVLMAKQTIDLNSTAAAYRRRRGRHPPPGFDGWYKFAQAHGAVMVEDFFDQIYDDLAPFWGLEAKLIRQYSRHFTQVISVKNRTTTVYTDQPRVWMNLWRDLISNIEEWLPDIDVPLNVMDESRVIVPWEDINRYIRKERESRSLFRPRRNATSNTVTPHGEDPGEPPAIEWIGQGPFWDVARVGCPPDSPSRNVPQVGSFAGPPPLSSEFPVGSYHGYIQNWTVAKDPCLQPILRETHGSFVEPISQSTTHHLIPVFGGSKLPMNNDILLPPAMYWTDDPFYSGGESHGSEWEEKTTKAVWRGGATGGRNREKNWTRFQRHRFVSMVNGTAVGLVEHDVEKQGKGPNFVLPSHNRYHLTAKRHMDMEPWLNGIADVGVVNLICYPDSGSPKCPYTDHYFSLKKSMEMKKQYSYKYLPDIDGNSFSGRYRGFLLSTSLPIKATIYSEWHDSRLVPWLHFVPMDNSFIDVYGILDYFIGTGTEVKAPGKNGANLGIVGAHDEQAKKIAMTGKEWAEKVLRKEDMLIYTMRLLLEWGRVSSDERLALGFTDDLNGNFTKAELHA